MEPKLILEWDDDDGNRMRLEASGNVTERTVKSTPIVTEGEIVGDQMFWLIEPDTVTGMVLTVELRFEQEGSEPACFITIEPVTEVPDAHH